MIVPARIQPWFEGSVSSASGVLYNVPTLNVSRRLNNPVARAAFQANSALVFGVNLN